MVDIMSKASWIMQTRQAAINYESFGIWGGEVGLMAYDCFKGLTKGLAVFNWCKSIRVLCNSNIAAINAIVDPGADGTIPYSYLDYSSIGACPYTPSDMLNEVLSAPVITTFTPMNGAAGTTVTITGVNFTGATAVKFNGVNATSFSVVNDTTITCVVPAGPIGSIISVTTSIGIVYSTYVYTRA
jgi:hypothetical protein